MFGFTLWRLHEVTSTSPPPRSDEARPRIFVLGKSSSWRAERASIAEPISNDDHFRFTIESAREGYLYVFALDEYADGTHGTPFLIYPSDLIGRGENQVAPGFLVDIPSDSDKTPVFSITTSRADQNAISLIILITPNPVPELKPQSEPTPAPPILFSRWEREWLGKMQTIENRPQAIRHLTIQEQSAKDRAKEPLDANGPIPASLFRCTACKPNDWMMQKIKLALK